MCLVTLHLGNLSLEKLDQRGLLVDFAVEVFQMLLAIFNLVEQSLVIGPHLLDLAVQRNEVVFEPLLLSLELPADVRAFFEVVELFDEVDELLDKRVQVLLLFLVLHVELVRRRRVWRGRSAGSSVLGTWRIVRTLRCRFS